MNRHNISYTRNHLSELIARVKEGETVWIVDRDQPVARLEPVTSYETADADVKASLVRRGILRPPRRRPNPKAFAALPLAKPIKGGDILAALLADREEGR